MSTLGKAAGIQSVIRVKLVLYWFLTATLTILYMSWAPTTSCTKVIVSCLIIALTFVGSLYAWRTHHHRDHPSTIQKRFVSVFIITVISPLPVYLFCGESNSRFLAKNRQLPIHQLLGLRIPGIVPAIVLPLFLTVLLFAGPLLIRALDGVFSFYVDRRYWSSNCRNLVWLRNHLVAPFSEEFSFRACMLPLLVGCFSEKISVIICPLFFGIAHAHHLIEKLRYRGDVQKVILETLFQFMYTTIFGAYSAFLFLRTGHFIAPFLVHSFCNHMGFPDFGEIFSYAQPKRSCILTAFVLGLICWCFLLYPATNPGLYDNDIYWQVAE